MSKPPISIVIPTHDSARMISGTSFARTLRDFEGIVVDEKGSTDSIGAVPAPSAGREGEDVEHGRAVASARQELGRAA